MTLEEAAEDAGNARNYLKRGMMVIISYHQESVIGYHQKVNNQLSPRGCHYHLTKTEDGSAAPAVHHKDAEDVARDLDHHTVKGNQYDHNEDKAFIKGDDDDGLPKHKVCVGSPT